MKVVFLPASLQPTCTACTMPGLLLFAKYINNLDNNACGLNSTLFDDTNIGGVLESEDGCLGIQSNIDCLESWGEQWQMEFNPDKDEVML